MITDVIRQKIRLSSINVKSHFVPNKITLGIFTGTTFDMILRITNGRSVIFDWGDTTSTIYTGIGESDISVSKNYGSVGVRTITVSGNISDILRIYIIATGSSIVINIDNLSKLISLNYLHLFNCGTSTGSINNFPASLRTLYLYNAGTVFTGSTDNLPVGLTSLVLVNCGVGISGSLNNLPAGLTYLRLYDNTGYSFIGSLDNLPVGLVYLNLYNLGVVITGSLNNLPVGLTYLYLVNIGTNITGSLNNLPVGLTSLEMLGIGATITGSLNNLPVGLTYLKLYQFPLLTGSIETLTALIDELYIVNCGASITYGGGAVPVWATVTLTVQTGISTALLDAFLISWAGTAGMGIKTIDLAGTNQPRSIASNAAVITLTGLGKTIITN